MDTITNEGRSWAPYEVTGNLADCLIADDRGAAERYLEDAHARWESGPDGIRITQHGGSDVRLSCDANGDRR